ncbi:hypothetical protein [Liquorilactobacillus vini]|nr:hypothetical protein [Liquorilactobacillus vini]
MVIGYIVIDGEVFLFALFTKFAMHSVNIDEHANINEMAVVSNFTNLFI